MANVTRREFVATSAAAAVATSTGGIKRQTIRKSQGGAGARGLAIVHTNDSHGHDVKDDDSMGFATVAAVRDSLEEQGFEVLVLDAGDACQGSVFANYSQGSSAIDLMNEVGYHAMAVGNHDFDYGQDVLAERSTQATFPFLSANIVDKESGELVFDANVTFTLKSGLKVGVFGLTTPETQTKTSKWLTEGLVFLEGSALYEAVQKQVDLLRSQGCGLVIALAHLGEDDTSAPNRAKDIVANVDGIDIVIDGHDHREEQAVMADVAGADVLVVETGCYTHAIGFITYEGGKLASTLLKPADFTGEDAQVAAVAASYQKEVHDEYGKTIATTPYLLSGKRKPGVRDHETNLADLIADGLLWAAQTAGETDAVCAIASGGSIRDSIDAGDITMEDVLTVQPFGSGVVTIKISGSDLLEALEAASQDCPDELGGFAQVAGITYEINTTVPYAQGAPYPNSTYFAPAKPGSRVTIREVGGAPFDKDSTYTVVTYDFNATGGDTYYAFSRHVDTMKITPYVDYQATCGYLTDALSGTVSADYSDENGEGRISVIE